MYSYLMNLLNFFHYVIVPNNYNLFYLFPKIFTQRMNERIKIFLGMLGQRKATVLLFGITIPCIILLIVSHQVHPTLISHLKKNNQPNNKSLLVLFAACNFNEVIMNFSIKILSQVCDFFTEAHISHFLYNQLYNLKLTEFEAKSPEEHYSEFLIMKEAFVKMVNFGIFSLPVNIICVLLHLYYLSKERIVINSILFSSMFLVYCVITVKGIQSREALRDQLNTATIAKKKFCRSTLDSYEVCKANLKEELFTTEFMKLHWKMTLIEVKYFFISENFRLATRSILVLIKILFIMIKFNNPAFDLAMVLCRINDLNIRLLSLRNDFYFFLEYWNELKINDNQIEFNNSNDNNIQSNYLNNNKDLDEIVSSGNLLNGGKVCVVARKKEQPIKLFQHNISIYENFEKDCTFHMNNYHSFCDKFNVIKFFNFIVLFEKSKTLIVGSQSCGKSTFLTELIGMKRKYWDFEFQNTLNSHELLKNVSFCAQKQLIFNKSIFFNLSYGTKLTNEEIMFKLKSLNVLDLFSQFENGLHTEVGTVTCGLSGGQRQLICVLRCVLKEADFYIFDQPTLFLDSENINIVYSLIEGLKDKTVIVTSTTDDSSRYFDHILYFNKS